jgi:hypothetical protein
MVNEPFRIRLSALALLPKTVSGLTPGLQRLTPTGKAVPFYATQRISLGQGRLLSWALRPLRLSLFLSDGMSLFLIPFPSRS